MRIRQDESGQVLVMTLLAMTLLLAFMALALDVGVLFRAKRNMQIAADAAAIAAALDYHHTASLTSAKAMGQTAATNNGVTNGVGGATVAINLPPAYGPYSSLGGSAEAIVIQPNPTVFMGLFNHSSVSVATRAVAGPVAGQSCIYLMNTTGTDLSVQGSSTITAPGGAQTCGIYVNSTSNNSVQVTGQGNTINTAYVATVGQLSANGNSNTIPTPTTHIATTQTPPSAASYYYPDPSTLTCSAPTGGTVTVGGNGANSITYNVLSGTVTPSNTLNATYNGSTYVVPYACYSGNVMLQGTSGSPLILNPGLYVFSGQYVDVGSYVGSPTATSAVTLDINSGSVTVNPTTSLYLSAPTSGAYDGAVLIAPSTNTSLWNVQWGSAYGSWDGLIVAPGANLTIQDQGGGVMTTGLIVGSLSMQAGTVIIKNYNTVHTTSPLNTIALVE